MAVKNYANLSAGDLLEKEFSIEFKGYKVEEVDQYLDRVIEDYNFYEAELSKKTSDLEKALSENNELKERIIKLEESLAGANERLKKFGNYAEENISLISRINNIEKKL